MCLFVPESIIHRVVSRDEIKALSKALKVKILLLVTFLSVISRKRKKLLVKPQKRRNRGYRSGSVLVRGAT